MDRAVAEHARGKPKVERGIPYCREDFSGASPSEASRRCRRHSPEAATSPARVHGTTRQVPRVAFETLEQPTLLSLEPFDCPTWAWATVHRDHHIELRRALYSVPTVYLGLRVEVRGDSRLMRIYYGGEMIKIHAPSHPAGVPPTMSTTPPSARGVHSPGRAGRPPPWARSCGGKWKVSCPENAKDGGPLFAPVRVP
jgi:hypothetical protein